jgi:hypothetical protein
MNPQYIDDDPRPRRSPRLHPDVGVLPYSRPTSSVLRKRLTESQIARIRRDLAIYAAIEGNMSYGMAAKVFGMSKSGLRDAYKRISRRKSRV